MVGIALAVAVGLPGNFGLVGGVGLTASGVAAAPVVAPQTGTTVNVRRFGASGSAQTTCGSILAGSHVLTLSSAIDFKDGMGIFIPNAGPLSTLGTPAAPTVKIGGGPSGQYTYGYRIVALDGRGGGSSASPVGWITNGPATLGGLGSNGAGNGLAINKANWLAISVGNLPAAPGGYAVYRTAVPQGSGLSTGFIGIYSYTNAPFLDFGQHVKTPPPGVPANPPTAPLGRSLVSIIRSGGGTRTLTLAGAASTSVVADRVFHDDTAAFRAALRTHPTRLYVPPGTYGISSALTFDTKDGLLYGSGRASLIRYQGNSASTLVLGASGITLKDMGFDGQKTADQLVTIRASHALRNITVRDTVGRSSAFYGIHAANASASLATWYTNIVVIGNLYTDCEYAIATDGNVKNVLINHNQVSFTDYNYAGRGISLHNSVTPQGYAYAQNFIIDGNTLRGGNHSAVIVIQGSGSGVITDNTLLVSGGIFAFWGIGAGRTVAASGHYFFDNNNCEALWRGTGVAVNLTNVVDVGVESNTIRGFGYGFEVGGYGLPAFPDLSTNDVVLADNRLSGIVLSPVLGTLPASVQYRNNQA